MRQFALLVFLCAVSCIENVYGDEVDRTVEDAYVEDGTAESMPDPDDINAPEEDPSIADRVAAEQVDESSNDSDGTEEETEPQADSEAGDTFTDTVQTQATEDADSKLETYTDRVEVQSADTASGSSEPDDANADSTPETPKEDDANSDSTSETPKEEDANSDSASETPKEDLALTGLGVNSSLSVIESEESHAGKFEPYNGDEIPKFAATFAGCRCIFNEVKRRWKCEGTIAFPAKVAGDECCCCTLKCMWRNRCTNEQCEAIGIDQAEEVAEEEKRMRELMKGADILIGEELPGFIVDLGQGRCDQNRIVNGCKAKGLTPLCDHNSYARGHCYSPGFPGTKFHNRHFSHWGSHRQYFGVDEEDYLFYGMCFYANNPNALAPCNGNSHCWTNGNHRLSPNSRVLATGPVPNIHFNEITSCNGGLGCWRTICVRNDPSPNGQR